MRVLSISGILVFSFFSLFMDERTPKMLSDEMESSTKKCWFERTINGLYAFGLTLPWTRLLDGGVIQTADFPATPDLPDF